jgi:alkylation response protein AidB-like acyl-CoA dehydrogenase
VANAARVAQSTCRCLLEGEVLALFTEEQEMLRDMAASLASSVGIGSPQDLETVDRAKGWRSVADAGLLGLRVRDSDGRPTSSGVEVMLVAEAFGGALVPLPYISSGVLAPELLTLADAPTEWVDELADGSVRCALLLQRDLSGLARVDDLAGAVAWGTDGAAYALALSNSSDAPHIVRVRLDESFAPMGSADLTGSFLLPPETPETGQLEEVGRPLTRDDLDRWLALALVTVSGDLTGVMRAAMQGVVAYSKERIAYGVPIGSFQAIQHMCADMLVRSESGTTTTSYAAWAVDELEPREALLAARTAKAYVALWGRVVTENVMQAYGGIGHTWEHIAHFYTRRALTDTQLFGDASEQLLRIADMRLGA